MQTSVVDCACQAAARGKPGRPPVYSEEERVRRILQAAEAVFTTAGYGAATMEEVARVAGMSKKTLYGLFPDKRRLLEAVVAVAADFPWAEADRMPVAGPLDELRYRLLAAAEFTLSPRQVRLTRLLIAEAEHAPELAEDFHERVTVKCQSYLAAAVGRAIRSGAGPQTADVKRVTRALFGAVMSDLHLGVLFGKSGVTRRQIAAHVEAALQLCGFISEPGQKGAGEKS